jgi:hypothetical protein
MELCLCEMISEKSLLPREILRLPDKLNEYEDILKPLGIFSLDGLLDEIRFFEQQGFKYSPLTDMLSGVEIPAAHTPKRGFLSIREANMISTRMRLGNKRHIEALNTLTYLRLKMIYDEITGCDRHNLYVPAD